MWERIETPYDVLLKGIQEQNSPHPQKWWFFGVLELMEEEDGVVGSCLYRHGLTEANFLRTATSVNSPLTEAVVVAAPPLLIY
jgi:hypothetical protein